MFEEERALVGGRGREDGCGGWKMEGAKGRNNSSGKERGDELRRMDIWGMWMIVR